MCLLISRKVILRELIDLDHRFGQRIIKAPQSRDHLEKRPCECAVNLLEGDASRVIDHEHGSVAQEPGTERYSARIGRRITCSDELYALEFHPRQISRPPEATVLDHLAHEGDDPLRAVRILGRQVDLVAKDD